MPTAVLERITPTGRANITQAYRYALDPTPEQANLLRSHIGGTRFAYNALLGLVKDNWDENRTKKSAGEEPSPADYLGTSHLDLQRLWYQQRNELAPWWAENGSSTYNYACLNLSKAFANWRKGTPKFPTFKRRASNGSVSLLSGTLRLVDSHHVRITAPRTPPRGQGVQPVEEGQRSSPEAPHQYRQRQREPHPRDHVDARQEP